MPCVSDEESGLNYSVHIQSPAEGSRHGRVTVDLLRKRQSTPVKSARSSSAVVKEIKTEVEDAEEEGSTGCPSKPSQSQKDRPSSTLSKPPVDDKPSKPSTTQTEKPSSTVSKPPADTKSSDVVPISQERFYKKTSASAASTGKATIASVPVSNLEPIKSGTLLRKEVNRKTELDDGEEVEAEVEEKFFLGLNYVKKDWQQQGKLIETLQKEVMAMRTEVSKTASLPIEVRKVGNDVTGLVENVNTFGTDFIDLRANMLGVTEHVQATKADMSSVEKSCHTIKGDTSIIKSSTETMKSRYLALSIEHQTILGQIKSSREDTQGLCTDLHGLKGEIESVKGDVRALKGDMVTVQKDVFAIKGDVACLRHDVTSLQSSANRIEEALSTIKSMIQPFPVVNVPIEEIKSDEDDVPPTPQKQGKKHSRQSLETSEELNTSEVTFRPHGCATYDKEKDKEKELFEDRPQEDTPDTQETQDPNVVSITEHFVPNTEDDVSQWPSSEEAGLVEYAEAGPSTSQPGYITVVGRTSADSEFQTVGYIKKLPEGTELPEVEDSPPETEGSKTPSSAKKRKTRTKNR